MLAGLLLLTSALCQGASAAQLPQSSAGLADELTSIRGHIEHLEESLIEGVQTQERARANIRKIRVLLKLQRRERELGKKRMAEISDTVTELESRRVTLRDRIKRQQGAIRKSLMAIQSSIEESSADKAQSLHLPDQEKLEAPRRRVLANLVDRGLKEVEALKIDLADADTLGGHIQEEKQQLAYLFQDLNEQESVLRLNQQLQSDILRRKHRERIAQLQNYRRLKDSEGQVEQLIKDFNARMELEQSIQTEREVSKAFRDSTFAKLQGRLPLPVTGGKVLSAFGRAYDPSSRLYVFKKGIDIAIAGDHAVRAITAGKIAYSGELPEYGKVAIIDHGDHYYSLCAHLGELSKKAGDLVAAGDVIGLSDDLGTPVYFEIRARNVAVNPLQWVSN